MHLEKHSFVCINDVFSSLTLIPSQPVDFLLSIFDIYIYIYIYIYIPISNTDIGGIENVAFWEVRALQKFNNSSGQLYWDPLVWSSCKNLETTDTKCALKTSDVSSDGRLLFTGLWPSVSVLIALHMMIICFIACKVIKIFLLVLPHLVIDTVALLHIFHKFRLPPKFVSVTWLALYQCSAMVAGFGVLPASFWGGYAYW